MSLLRTVNEKLKRERETAGIIWSFLLLWKSLWSLFWLLCTKSEQQISEELRFKHHYTRTINWISLQIFWVHAKNKTTELLLSFFYLNQKLDIDSMTFTCLRSEFYSGTWSIRLNELSSHHDFLYVYIVTMSNFILADVIFFGFRKSTKHAHNVQHTHILFHMWYQTVIWHVEFLRDLKRSKDHSFISTLVEYFQ